MLRHLILVVLAIALNPCGSAQAGKLGPTAVPLTAEEVTKLHAGNTGTYPTIDEYFSPDGTTIGVFGKPAVKSVFAGRWLAVGNTLCTLNGSAYAPKVYVDCNSFWRDGDKTLLQWSTRSDGSKPDPVNGYYDNAGALKPGNLVVDRYKAAGGT